jgi:hypothetical protein
MLAIVKSAGRWRLDTNTYKDSGQPFAAAPALTVQRGQQSCWSCAPHSMSRETTRSVPTSESYCSCCGTAATSSIGSSRRSTRFLDRPTRVSLIRTLRVGRPMAPEQVSAERLACNCVRACGYRYILMMRHRCSRVVMRAADVYLLRARTSGTLPRITELTSLQGSTCFFIFADAEPD